MDRPWDYEDFIISGDVIKGMTKQGKDKVKATIAETGSYELVIPTEGPDGTPIRVIADNCFYRRFVTSVVIPETVEEIGYDAFGVCNLEEVILPDSVKRIKGFAFYRNKLKDIKFSANLEEIRPSAFALNELSEIHLPDSLQTIGASAFYKNKIQSVKLPKNLEKVDMFAFHKNPLLQAEVPAGANVHKNAFESNCTVEEY